jgi:lipoprotein-anchoring transpeptidase ErfK/SrfK
VHRLAVAVGVAACALAATALLVVVISAVSTGEPSAAPRLVPHDPSTTTSTSTAPATPAVATAPPGTTLVATTHGAIPGYPVPGGPSDTTVPGTWFGYPSVLPVIAARPGWLDVRLAQRPNGSTTWVQQSDVTLGSTPYAMVVDLATMRLTVYQQGTAIMDFPAGIGAPSDPTPPGEYFIAMTVPPPSPAYGAMVLVTSDHSDSITDWENSGDAVIGIHGPITSDDDSLIGTTGAAISHGCIRLHDADLARLSVIPPGTPLEIVN